MCIDFDGHHFVGISFVDAYYILILLYIYIYKKNTGKESQYIVSHLELSLDPPFRPDRESGCDNSLLLLWVTTNISSRSLMIIPIWFC